MKRNNWNGIPNGQRYVINKGMQEAVELGPWREVTQISLAREVELTQVTDAQLQEPQQPESLPAETYVPGSNLYL